MDSDNIAVDVGFPQSVPRPEPIPVVPNPDQVPMVEDGTPPEEPANIVSPTLHLSQLKWKPYVVNPSNLPRLCKQKFQKTNSIAWEDTY